ncbi:GrpB family protein [Paenibacillus aestuarii]|uniref:GrpB family protein n=1 Tax=Paenibacillus aestuarii TaxID=516965 RepID=A0ABW0KF82_9BACL|nr:GrpB family protein [Paenibacillus aestuarii]
METFDGLLSYIRGMGMCMGLPAKPIVDMVFVVATRNDVEIAIERLATLGYIHEGDLEITGREAFIPPCGVPWHHLYVCAIDNVEYSRGKILSLF